jgi:hypothetical protein
MMNTPITFTPAELSTMVLGICGALITLSGALAVIVNLVKKAKEPELVQNDRIDKIENDIRKIQHCLSIDKARLDNIEYGNVVSQEALLALLNHALNKDDVDSVKNAKQKLEKYLIDKEKLPYKYDEF